MGGAFNTRETTLPLGAELASEFSAVSYDRRGRGGSEDSAAYAVEREIEDLAAVIEAVGGSARVYGMSSGAILALRAVAAGVPAVSVAVYEPPFGSVSPAFAAEQAGRIAAGDRAGAVAAFFRVTGIPDEMIEAMRGAPEWPWFLGLAHTLPYDAAVVGDGSVPDLSRIGVPALVVNGAASPPFLAEGAAAAVAGVPGAVGMTLPGQTHHVDEKVLAPVLMDFYRAE
ncbi:alpha/beta fold hydrolase [Actinokineospora sp. G85]|uniref:alpha/beta fold hydrolase n=1 Tax=Actinokineospora sp. G85 TaxID=3406626 RepID=UPI003C728D1F